MITLKDYQTKALRNIFQDWNSFNRILLMAATGTGKTVMFLATADRILDENPAARILIIAHRRELIYQPIERAAQFWPHIHQKMGIVMANQNDFASQVIVSTIQSLTSGDRLEKIQSAGEIGFVIIDEAHHGTSDTYRKVIDSLPNAKVLGCTATPKRTDRQALGQIFQKVTFKYSILDAIKDGALCEFTPMGFSLPADAEQIEETEDGWEPEPMGDLLSAENVLEVVLGKFQQYASNRQAIGFTASVAQAHATSAYFNAHGINAEAVDGTTPKQTRDAILRRYKTGETQAIFNCMVLTEGFDAPETSAVLMVAPTRSDLIYVQRLGRGLRTAPGKADCIVLDFAPKGTRNIVMAGDVLDGELPKKDKEKVEKAEDEGLLFGFSVRKESGIGLVDPHEVQMEVLDYLGRHKLAWTFDGDIASAGITDSAMLAIVLPDEARLAKADEMRRQGKLSDAGKRLETFIAGFRFYKVIKDVYGYDEKGNEKYVWNAILAGNHPTMALAKENAEAEYEQLAQKDTLSGKAKKWRNEPVSEPQANYLRKLGCFEEGLTKGQAAQRITHTLAKRAITKAEEINQKSTMNGF